jgi:preprotein translocase subunit SecY
MPAHFQGFPAANLVLIHPLWWYRIQTTVILTTGTMLLMWLGEQITDRGIGNGISLIITVNILARLPAAGQGLWDMFLDDRIAMGSIASTIFHFIALVLLLFAVIAGVVAVTQAERKIPVQYAQRVVGRKMYSGGSSFMPLRVNYSGVMPVIFASAILMFPTMILVSWAGGYHWKVFDELACFAAAVHALPILYGLMILFFSYFWVATQFNELQISDDMKKSGGYIPGVRPGTGHQQLSASHHEPHHAGGRAFLTIIAVIPIILARP